MELETKRLRIIPLTTKQLQLWLESIPHLTEELECFYPSGMLEGKLKEAVAAQLEMAKTDKENSQWHTFWFLLRQVDRMAIGAVDFKNAPNAAGEVEIGYGLGKAFENQGYMTEAVEALCQWAKAQPGVRYVLAETELANIESENILQQCGFTAESKNAKTIKWRL